MMIIKEFREEDLERFNRLRPDITLGANSADAIIKSADYSFTYMVDEFPVAIAGCTKVWSGVGQIWAFVTYKARGHGHNLIKAMRFTMKTYGRRDGFWRFQTVVDPEVEENVRFAKMCGFKYESNMHLASPDCRDLHMYTIFWKQNIKHREEPKWQQQHQLYQ